MKLDIENSIYNKNHECIFIMMIKKIINAILEKLKI